MNNFSVRKISRNVHEIKAEGANTKLAILSDLHWDNPKCDWDKLKKHLDYCVFHEIPVMINGDFFCLMQGKGDPRKSKDDIRPEHNTAKYLDAIVETAVEWFTPYANILTVIGYGNHETSIIKHQETDILQRFVDMLNYKCKTNVYTGGYGGWIVYKMKTNNGSGSHSKYINYYHGSGGGGVVTRGEINLTRALEIYDNMDVFLLAHIHENKSTNIVKDSLQYNPGKKIHEIVHKNIHMMVTGTYKEEYGDGFGGWHKERNAPPKMVGGRILTFNLIRYQKSKRSHFEVLIDSIKFPV
jgi:hypothetical protein